MADVNNYGLTRVALVPQYTEGQPGALSVTPRGEQIIAHGLPENTELVRQGNSFVIRAAAIACVTAIPTTTAPISIWNGEPVGNLSSKSYVIDDITWVCTTSAGAASMFSILAMVNVLPVTAAPATADTLVVSSLNGKKYAGRAAMSHTVTVVDDKWIALGGAVNSAALTATVGAQVSVPVKGSIILAPGYLLNLACLAVNTTAVGQFCVRYHEVVLIDAL